MSHRAKRIAKFRGWLGIPAQRLSAGIRKLNNRWACSDWSPPWGVGLSLEKSCQGLSRDVATAFLTFRLPPAVEICHSKREPGWRTISALALIFGPWRMFVEPRFALHQNASPSRTSLNQR